VEGRLGEALWECRAVPRLSEILPSAREWAKRYTSRYPQTGDVVGIHIAVLETQARWEERVWPSIPAHPELFGETVRAGRVLVEETGMPMGIQYGYIFNDVVSTVAFYDASDSAVGEVCSAARKILEAIGSGRLEPLSVVSDVLRRGEEAVKEYSSIAGVAEEYFNTFMFWTLQPVLHAYMLRNAEGRLREKVWRKTICPVCGSPTRTGYREPGGAEYLKCPTCGMEWRVEEGKCPWCGSGDVEEYRPIRGMDWLVMRICGCGGYLRIVDEGVEDEGLRPPRWLYELAATPLDEAYRLMTEEE